MCSFSKFFERSIYNIPRYFSFFNINYESREGTNFIKHVLYNNTFHNFLQLELLQLTFIVKTALKDLLSPSL